MGATYEQTVHPVQRPVFPEAWDEPDLWIPLVGCFRSLGGFEYRQVSPGVAVHCVHAGEGVFTADGVPYPARGGDLFVFFPGQYLEYADAPRRPWRYTWFPLRGRLAAWALGRCGIGPASPHRAGAVTGDLAALVGDLVLRARRGGLANLDPVAQAWRFVELVATAAPGPSAGGGAARVAEACRALIEGSYGEIPGVAQMSERLGVDRSTLYRDFVKRFGVPPKAFAEEWVMRRAADLLKRSAMSVQEVAAACGYRHVGYFVRQFHARHGMPPGAWRAKKQGKTRKQG